MCRDGKDSGKFTGTAKVRPFSLYRKPTSGGPAKSCGTGVKRSHSPLVPITFHQLDNIAFGITEENDPTAGDELTHIDDRIGFDAVCSQCFNSRFKPRHVFVHDRDFPVIGDKAENPLDCLGLCPRASPQRVPWHVERLA